MMEWSFSNKVSGGQFLSFKGGEKPKVGFESLASTGLVSITTMESFDSMQKSCSGPGVVQKNMVPEKQGVVQYTMSSYPATYMDARSICHPDVRMHQIPGQTNPALPVAPPQKLQTSPACLRRSASSNALKLGEVPLTGALPAISTGTNVVGTTNLRNDSNSMVKAAQLTIFYNGSVCVYDDISPEKAQAIMLLAGNGPPPVQSSTAVHTAPVQSAALMSPVLDGLIPNRGHSLRPSSPTPISVVIPSHISFSSCVGSQSARGPGLDITPVKSSLVLSAPLGEPSTAFSMQRSFPDTSKSSAVPQARKASLARFLDRRKGRIISTSPYAKNESSDAKATTSTTISLEMSSSSHCPVPATN